jgi:predicted anti-sigma-YlaC factor YlaD
MTRAADNRRAHARASGDLGRARRPNGRHGPATTHVRRRAASKHGRRAAPVALLLAGALTGCSIQHYAVRSLGNMLAAGGTAFESDGDPALIGEALPFSLKLTESLLQEQPNHRGLLLAAARGYLLYSYAFVDLPAEEAQFVDFDRSRALRKRSRNLYLRAHAYASRALELDYPGVGAQLVRAPKEAVADIDDPDRDVPVLYLTAASLGLAIASSGNEPALLARLPEVEALLGRALELNDRWNAGALHEFAIDLAASGVVNLGEGAIEAHFHQALTLSGGHRASVYVAYAEAVAVPTQDREQFVELMNRALAVDIDAVPQERLLNVVAQRRARWLLNNVHELILE